MKRSLLLLLGAAMFLPADAYQIDLNGAQHEIDELISVSIGPGMTYKRLRSETYPLNINMLIMDLNNPYNRMETTTANESAMGTEKLVDAAARQTTAEKRPIAGANGNFWCVSTQKPWAPILTGSSFGGHTRNGQPVTELNMNADQWNAGWMHSASFSVDVNKVARAAHLKYNGIVQNSKIGAYNIHQINKVVRPEEICLYTTIYGANKKFSPVTQSGNEFILTPGSCTEVLLDFKEGETWRMTGPMTFIVKEVRTNAGDGILGEYDAAIVGGGNLAIPGANSPLSALTVGEELTVTTGYYESNDTPIYVDNSIGGHGLVMQDGEETASNDTDAYGAMVYSRCGYGCSADGKTVYVIVIDRSTDPVYGESAGCPTRVMCDIARYYGCDDLASMDAGGSAQMYYNGAIINKTTEGTPRAVSNGMFMYSIAPEDKTVARLEFYDITLQAPVYSSLTPRVVSYNQYGDVLDYDFKDFTLSCDAELGKCDGNTFVAGNTAMTGQLTASYNGVSVTKDITVTAGDAVVSYRISPLLIDDVREYPIEVIGTIGEDVFNYNPAHLDFEVGDLSIISVDENGVLRGLKNGETSLKVKVGETEIENTVKVEIPYAKLVPVTDYADWTFKKSGVNNPAIAEDGAVSFTLAAGRAAPYLELVKKAAFYGIPENLCLSFESDVQVDRIQIDVRTPLGTRANYYEATNADAGFAATTEHRIEIPLTSWGDVNDLISFPMSLNSIKFTFPKDASLNGEHSLKIKALETSYDHVAGVEDVIQDLAAASIGVTPNPVVDGVMNVVANAELRSVAIYTTSGMLVGTHKVSGNHDAINVSDLASGLYIALVETSAGSKAVRVIVK